MKDNIIEETNNDSPVDLSDKRLIYKVENGIVTVIDKITYKVEI